MIERDKSSRKILRRGGGGGGSRICVSAGSGGVVVGGGGGETTVFVRGGGGGHRHADATETIATRPSRHGRGEEDAAHGRRITTVPPAHGGAWRRVGCSNEIDAETIFVVLLLLLLHVLLHTTAAGASSSSSHLLRHVLLRSGDWQGHGRPSFSFSLSSHPSLVLSPQLLFTRARWAGNVRLLFLVVSHLVYELVHKVTHIGRFSCEASHSSASTRDIRGCSAMSSFGFESWLR